MYLVTVQIDGTTVYSGTPDSNEGRCAPIGESGGTLMFDHSQPCRTSESVDLPIDTATLANGEHTLKVTVEDAAQKRASSTTARSQRSSRRTTRSARYPARRERGRPPGLSLQDSGSRMAPRPAREPSCTLVSAAG